MELAGYRETLATLNEMFPGRVAIDVDECARALGVNVKTVYSSIKRVKNPLPTVNMGTRRVTIPIAQLARWLCIRK
ncbi:MAG: hypothetical protein IJ038_05190 [Clostridia bacterium]|nr:hypothetical protein [Clostridia bacterium]